MVESKNFAIQVLKKQLKGTITLLTLRVITERGARRLVVRTRGRQQLVQVDNHVLGTIRDTLRGNIEVTLML